MAETCILFYITDRTALAPDEPSRRQRLLDKIADAARARVDYVQLREKDLPAHQLEGLAQEAVRIVREANKVATGERQPITALLINSRTDIALAVGADGVHLRSDDISPQEVRKMWRSAAGMRGAEAHAREPVIGVSCHLPDEVTQTVRYGASFAVFAPVFEKKDSPEAKPAGLARLEQACRAPIPVLALGGVNLENVQACLKAGAAGIAAIRLFQEHDVADVVSRLRHM